MKDTGRKAEQKHLYKKRIQQQSHWTQVAEHQREEAAKYSRYCTELKAMRALEKRGLFQGTVPTFEQWDQNNRLAEAEEGCDLMDNCDECGGDGDEDHSDFCDIVDGDFTPCGGDGDGGRSLPCRPTELMRIMKAADPRTDWATNQAKKINRRSELDDDSEDLGGVGDDCDYDCDDAAARKMEAAARTANIRKDISAFNKEKKKKQDRLLASKKGVACSTAVDEDEDNYFSSDRIKRAAARKARADRQQLAAGGTMYFATEENRRNHEMNALREKYRTQFSASQKLQQVLVKLDTLIEQSEQNYRNLHQQMQEVLKNGSQGAIMDEELSDLRAHIEQLQRSRNDAEVKKVYVDGQTNSLNQEMRNLTQRSFVKRSGGQEKDDDENDSCEKAQEAAMRRDEVKRSGVGLGVVEERADADMDGSGRSLAKITNLCEGSRAKPLEDRKYSQDNSSPSFLPEIRPINRSR
jgi:hypothetical protein